MSYLLKFVPFHGPIRFVWKDPDTEVEFVAKSKDELMSQIVAYRTSNNLEPIDFLSATLENYWCILPENQSACEPVENLPRGFFPTLKAGVPILKNVFYKQTVSDDEANRRAARCTTCPYNQFPNRSTFIEYTNRIAEQMLGGTDRQTIDHDRLGECAVCKCPLKGKVFYDGKVPLDDDQIAAMKSVDCWQIALVDK